MENLRFAIAAGETKVFERGGRYIEIIEAAGAVNLNLYDQNGGQSDSAKGILSGTYMEGAYAKFEVYSATAQTVEILITDTRGGTRRQPGNVRIIDNSADKTAGGTQFMGSAQIAASAAQGSIVMIRAAGTRAVAVKAITVSSSVTGAVLLCSGVVGTLVPASPMPSKLLRATASSSARIGAFNVAGSLPSVGEVGSQAGIARLQVPANTQTKFELTTPIVLQPGNDVMFINAEALNKDLVGYFDVEEL